MPRQNIFEIIKAKYNLAQEMNKLMFLFSKPQIYYSDYDDYLSSRIYQFTIEDLCDKELLFQWKQRSTCLTCQEIKKLIGFPEVFSDATPMDLILSCLEYYYNILLLATKKDPKYKYIIKSMSLISQNIEAIREHLHYDKYTDKEEEMVLLVPKNPAATAVAEISSKDTAFAILKYHHASLKGNLAEKKKLLLSIANEYEPLLAKPVSGFTDYFDKATGLLNNLNLRHNNKTGKHKIDAIANMPPEELENWYDDLYQLLLFCVLIKDNTARKDKAANLLKTIKTVKQ